MTVESMNLVDGVVFSPQTVTDAATITANIDTVGAAWATIIVNYTAEETTHATASTLSLLESDDTVVTNFATITANLSEDLVSAKRTRYEVDLKGRKRYLRVSFTAGTTTGGNITLGAISLLGRYQGAVAGVASTSDMGADTVVIV